MAAAGHLTRRRLAGHSYLARDEGSGTESIAREILGDAYEAVSKLHLGHLDVVRTAALQGLGFAALPRIAVADELEVGRLKELPSRPDAGGSGRSGGRRRERCWTPFGES